MDCSEWLSPNRIIEERLTNLTCCLLSLKQNEWHQYKIIVGGTNIQAYIDDELKRDYRDSDLPLIFGGIAFDVGPDAHVLFDDIDVNVSELEFETN